MAHLVAIAAQESLITPMALMRWMSWCHAKRKGAADTAYVSAALLRVATGPRNGTQYAPTVVVAKGCPYGPQPHACGVLSC